MRFEVGKYYEHSTGKKMHILGEVNSDIYYSPGLVAEDLEGNFIPVGIGEEYVVNWNEISEVEWLNELKLRAIVCEYKEQKNKFVQHIFITSCGKDIIQYGFMFEYNYCPYCGKKIRIVE